MAGELKDQSWILSEKKSKALSLLLVSLALSVVVLLLAVYLAIAVVRLGKQNNDQESRIQMCFGKIDKLEKHLEGLVTKKTNLTDAKSKSCILGENSIDEE